MKTELRNLSKVEQEKIELEYHRTKPEAFDKGMVEAKRRLLEAIADVEQDRNIVVPDQE
jgi:translation elongation factor EF-G